LPFFIGNLLWAVLLVGAYFFECSPFKILEIVIFFFMIDMNYELVLWRWLLTKQAGNFPVKVNGAVTLFQVKIKRSIP
jgi:hypothetical protein